MNIWKSIAGMMELEITSADISRCLSAISEANVAIFHVQSDSPLVAKFRIYRKDYPFIRKLCEKRGETIKIQSRSGLFWIGKTLMKRPLLSISMLVLLLGTLMIPRFVFFVQVTGNVSVPKKQILEAAKESGIAFGASRREVRSERVKNALLSQIPQLQWAGINTRGCVAVISVREKTTTQDPDEEHCVSSIVAARDGVVLNCTASRGNLLCAEGQGVREGEVLISGYTDCGISIQATRAKGEVYARTLRELTTVTPRKWVRRTAETDSKYVITLLVEKNRIILWKDSGISDVTCGRMYKEYYVTLPGGFRLPVALCVEVFSQWDLTSGILEAENTFSQEFAKAYLTRQMVAGTIVQSRETLTQDELRYVLQGSYICEEMIGREKSEKLGEANEQTD